MHCSNGQEQEKKKTNPAKTEISTNQLRFQISRTAEKVGSRKSPQQHCLVTLNCRHLGEL